MDISKVRSDKVQDAQVKDLQKSQKGSATKQADQLDSVTSTPKQSPGSSENVKWSDNASLYSEALQTAKNTPDVRADRVSELKAQIKNGTYKVDAKAVADKMLKSVVDEGR